MTEAIRIAIESAEVDALRSHVAADPALAEAYVTYGDSGEIVVPPLHAVCDAVFRKLATEAQALAMAEVLLDAGVDPDRSYAKSGDTYLITAASLGAERVGLRLVEAGADVTRRGLFGATALHWAAYMGLQRLTRSLVAAGSERELADAHYDCTPLQWALYGWSEPTNGRREELPGVVAALVALGARVPAGALDGLTSDSDEKLRAALSSGPSR